MKKIFKKLGLGILYTIAAIYIIFLILPIIINPFLSSYSEQISKMAEESCGLKIKIEKLGIITTPKLTVGIRIKNITAAIPNGDEFLSADNLKAKLSLIPLVSKKVEADVFSIDNIDLALKIKPDGNLEIIDYLPDANKEETKEQLTELPLGLKLSNKLPNIYVREYCLSMIDMKSRKEYTLQGGNLKITDFIINKKIKITTGGIAKLDGTEQFSYDIKILNKIMPEVELNDLIFAQVGTTEEIEDNTKIQEAPKPLPFSIFDIFEGIKRSGLSADLKINTTISGTPKDIHILGLIDINKLSMLINGERLPDGHIKFNFKGKKALADISLYTAKDELTTVLGEINHGKNPHLDLTIKSKAGINNIFSVIKSIAASFNYKELDTLTATGNIDADFNIKSDLKQVKSNGYLKIPSATVRYALYNIFIDKINADINLDNNNLNIKNIGLTILNQPLKIFGTISEKAIADLHIKADNLMIKGLLTAAGQINLLKENDIKSGNITFDAQIKGKLDKIEPIAEVKVNNVNLTNKPSDTTIKFNLANIKISSDGKNYKGDINSNAISVTNPAAKFTLPQLKVNLNEKDVKISDTYLLIDNSKINISGNVTNYTTKDLSINIFANGNIFANDIRTMLPQDIRSLFTAKGAIPILIKVTGNDKKQTVFIQALTTPNGYLHIADLQSITGKSMLINSIININGNSISLDNTGAYATSKTTLSNNTDSNFGGTQILKVTGGISDISAMKLSSLNIATIGTQSISIPTFKNSLAKLNTNITLNGNALNPEIKGNISASEVTIPTLKMTLKDSILHFGKNITANLPLINIANSSMNAKAEINPNFSSGIIINNLDFNANMIDSDTLISALSNMPSSSGSESGDLGIIIQNGTGKVTKFKSGKIIATELSSDFNLKNNVFTLKNLTGKAFDGNINGKISCNVIKGTTSVDMTGNSMKAVNAIDAAAGIPNALSGILGFDAKLNLNAYAPDFNAMLKSVKGVATFEIKDGHYLNIGTIDQFVLAGNVASNAILKAALLPIKKTPVIQNSSNFKTLSGKVDLADGIATLTPVKSAGPSIAYYITGKYNLINGYTNVVILGRMGADVVAALGPLGQLSVSKLTSYLPKFGTQTLNIINTLTSNPIKENLSLIPKLSGNSDNYKDFKVIFNGNVTSPTSIKTFKWLSQCDTSEIQNGSLKDQVKTGVDAIKQTGQNNIQDVKKSVEDVKNAAKTTAEDVRNQVQKTKDSIQELKNLKNMFKTPSSNTSTPAPATTSSTTSSQAPAATATTTTPKTTTKPATSQATTETSQKASSPTASTTSAAPTETTATEQPAAKASTQTETTSSPASEATSNE